MRPALAWVACSAAAIAAGPSIDGAPSAPAASDAQRFKCHAGIRRLPTDAEPGEARNCDGYVVPPAPDDDFPQLDPGCLSVTWAEAENASKANPAIGPWGSCMKMRTDATHRYISSNTVPDYYFDPYCPFGLFEGYCIDGEPCPFPHLRCGITKSRGFTPMGDVWSAQLNHYKMPLEGNPTDPGVPRDMYDSASHGGAKTVGSTIGVHCEPTCPSLFTRL